MSNELSKSIQDDIREAEGDWALAAVECKDCCHQWIARFRVQTAIADLHCELCGQRSRRTTIQGSQ